MSNPQYLAQIGHFLGGLSVVFVLGAFTSETGMWVTFGIGVLLAAFKEFVFDTASWGEGDSLADSAMDFAFYVAGGMMGAALFLLAVAWHVTFH
jgi:hypothetical protein